MGRACLVFKGASHFALLAHAVSLYNLNPPHTDQHIHASPFLYDNIFQYPWLDKPLQKMDAMGLSRALWVPGVETLCCNHHNERIACHGGQVNAQVLAYS
eukprot:jgi/Botrbrau1/12342/Bobra.4_3s0014.1